MYCGNPASRNLSSPPTVPSPPRAAKVLKTLPHDLPPLQSLTVTLLAPKPRIEQAPPVLLERTRIKHPGYPHPATSTKRLPSSEARQLLQTHPPSPQAPSRLSLDFTPAESTTHGTILVPASSPEDPELDFSEFLLEDLVQVDDLFWEEHLTLCHHAIEKLGFHGPKSDKQLKAMILILDGWTNCFMVLSTFFGKSMLYQITAVLSAEFKIDRNPRGGNLIVVTPFTALLVDQANESAPLSIKTYNWQDRESIGPVPVSTRLIFIQPESFISFGFQK